MEKALIVIVVILVIIVGAAWFWYRPNAPLKEVVNQQFLSQTGTRTIENMKIETLKEGTGPEAKSGDAVTVNYIGTLQDGTKFDSSLDRNQAFSFTLGQSSVIRGWELGVVGMRVGERRKLTIPPELGYGSRAVGDLIPPNSTLIFEIDLLTIN